MKIRVNHPIHNPFESISRSRTLRLDEMPAYTHMAWLHSPMLINQQTNAAKHPRNWAGALAGAFALVLVVLVSAALL
jgi:hypothetical protein